MPHPGSTETLQFLAGLILFKEVQKLDWQRASERKINFLKEGKSLADINEKGKNRGVLSIPEKKGYREEGLEGRVVEVSPVEEVKKIKSFSIQGKNRKNHILLIW